MMPTDQLDFTKLVEQLFAVYGRNVSSTTIKPWWTALNGYALSVIEPIIMGFIKAPPESMPSPNKVIARIQAEDPRTQRASEPRWTPRKTHLLAARSHMEMHGEVKARAAYGDEAVELVLAEDGR